MIRREKNSIEEHPCYRLTDCRMGFEILRFVGYENAKPENRGTYYKEPEEFPELVASVTSKEAAEAVMRLWGVTQYEDWTHEVRS